MNYHIRDFKDIKDIRNLEYYKVRLSLFPNRVNVILKKIIQIIKK